MQVFQTFFKIASKRIGAISTYFIIYIFVTFALSFSTADTAETQFQASSLTISILDEDSSTASRALTAFLSSLHKTDASETDTEALADRLYYRTLDYVLIIPDGFEEKLLSGDTEALLSDVKIPGSTNGSFVDQQITQYIETLQLYLAGGCTLSEAIAYTDASAADSASVTAVSFSSQDVKADSRLFYFYQYLPYIFICIQFMGLAPILVTENSPGIRERTACSSLSFSRRNLQLAAACTVYSVGVWLIFMLFAFLCFGRTLFFTFPLLGMLNSFVFLLFTTALALFISLFSPGSNVLNMIANIIGLSMAFFCGVFISQEMLPDAVLSAGRFLPAYWYIKANNMLGGFSNEVFDMDVYLQCLGIELLFAAAIIAVMLAYLRAKDMSAGGTPRKMPHRPFSFFRFRF